MVDAVIVSTARTGLAKSWRGAFNMTYGPTLAAHSIEHAVKRAGIDPAEVEDVILGAAMLEGTTGGNVARVAALRAGLPVTTGGVSINRFCSSGLQAIAMADHRGHPQGQGLGVAHGEGLGDELPHHERQVGDGEHDDRDRERLGERPQPGPGQRGDRGLEPLDGGDAADRGGQRADQRDPDLHGGEEAVRVQLQAQGGGGSGVAVLRQGPQARGAGTHHRHLRPGEECVEEDQDPDQGQLDDEPVFAHGAILAPPGTPRKPPAYASAPTRDLSKRSTTAAVTRSPVTLRTVRHMSRSRSTPRTIQAKPYRRVVRRWADNREQTLGVNIREEDDTYLLSSLVPGLKAEDLNIQVLDDVVRIEGEYKADENEYLLRELPGGSFTRTLRLPVAIEADSVEAKMRTVS